jgi:glycosyltransferase involved in cell wall biosynthesis
MDSRITQLLEYCELNDLQSPILVFPFPVSDKDIQQILAIDQIGGIAIVTPPSNDLKQQFNRRRGVYRPEQGQCELPIAVGPILFAGLDNSISKWIFAAALKRGQFSILCRRPDKLIRVTLLQYIRNSINTGWTRFKTQIPSDNLFVKIVRAARQLFSNSKDTSLSQTTFREPDKSLFSEYLQRALMAAPAEGFIPGRVVLINAGLAAGGAERQIVNTLLGLKEQPLESVSLICEYIFSLSDLGFYLAEVEAAGITVNQVPRHIDSINQGLKKLPPDLVPLFSALPLHLGKEILNLAEEFRIRRPEVVHAWQDSTSIKVAIAAVIAGVPHIIMSSRNVNPTNFGYYQPYMRPAYQALADFPHIRFINNSEAGMRDYQNWLGLSDEVFRVVRNGVKLHHLKRALENDVQQFRTHLGIPIDAPVVGSIFRFWPEKRPLLWLECIAKVLQLIPHAHFILVGEGPMRKDMDSFLAKHNELSRHLHFIPPTNAINLPLAAMQVFLLTSRFEGTPNVILEAQWLGVPVVALNAGGTAEAIKDGVTGLVCQSDNPEEIGRLIVTILSDIQWQRRVREMGPQFIRERFGYDRMIAETMELYGYSYLHRRRSDNEDHACTA